MYYYAGMDLEKTNPSPGITSPLFRVHSVDDKGIFIYPYWKLSNGYIHHGVIKYVLFNDVQSAYGMKPVTAEFSILA